MKTKKEKQPEKKVKAQDKRKKEISEKDLGKVAGGGSKSGFAVGSFSKGD